jgi:hypothetical protein
LIESRAECPSGAGDDDGADVGIGFGFIQCVMQFF